MEFRTIVDTVGVNTDVNGEFSFTVRLPLGFSNVVYSNLSEGYIFAYPLIASVGVTEREDSPGIGGPDAWTGVVSTQFYGKAGVISGVVVIRFSLILSDQATTYNNYNSHTSSPFTITQP